MPTAAARLLLLLPLLVAGCVSAGDRLNEGIELQSQGRYMQAVYSYAEAVEKDQSLIAAQDRLVASGDSALMIAMDEADLLERRDDPVGAAAKYRDIDRMLARIRSVGQRVDQPADYEMIRRGVFDQAIEWQMAVGHEAADQGRWLDAQEAYQGARGDFMPSRAQLETSLEAETDLLLRWAEVELSDHRPRAAFEVARAAQEVRSSPAREVVLAVRDLQDRALAAGTIVVAVPPVTAEGGVREFLGPEFEIGLDDDLLRDHWTQPPLFIDVSDPLILRRELRGLLRGVSQSPLLVGQALDLVGADLGVLIQLSAIEVLEEDVRRRRHEADIVARPGNGRGPSGERPGNGRGPEGQPQTVEYFVVSGDMSYHVEAEVVLVDPSGREVAGFTVESHQAGPFERGEYDGNWDRLDLSDDHIDLFDPRAMLAQRGPIEAAVMEELAAAISRGTFELILSRVP